MKSLTIGALLALLIGLAPVASAVDVELTWQLPTRDVDGDMIPATGDGSLTETIIEWGSCTAGNAFGTSGGMQSFPAPATRGTIDLPRGQTYCFRGFSINTFGEMSSASNVVDRMIPAPVPLPPVLSSTVSIVWDLWQDNRGRERLAFVGTAPIGSPCGEAAIAAAGIYQIDPDLVTLRRKNIRGHLVTMCG